ncbi:hypothetical protein BLTE_20030 [Blastochloris tepida]|uniref:Uncharacterized protein n=1 Tax=Blastochloris tepida TaxID=2233851 RepID=A0A348G185_9HYPH|nr:hypothetical protein BLTE_20030 [Blastochloris tepida]
MPRHLLRLLGLNALAGAGAAVVLVALLVAFDAHGLGTLMARSETPLLPLAVLTFGFIVTLSSVAMGAAVMLLPRGDSEPRGTAKVPVGELVPVRVAARAKRR